MYNASKSCIVKNHLWFLFLWLIAITTIIPHNASVHRQEPSLDHGDNAFDLAVSGCVTQAIAHLRNGTDLEPTSGCCHRYCHRSQFVPMMDPNEVRGCISLLVAYSLYACRRRPCRKGLKLLRNGQERLELLLMLMPSLVAMLMTSLVALRGRSTPLPFLLVLPSFPPFPER